MKSQSKYKLKKTNYKNFKKVSKVSIGTQNKIYH